MSEDNRSSIDKLFDIADNVVGGLETALKPQENPIAASVIDVGIIGWAVAHDGRNEAWHVFTPQSPIALCGKEFTAAQVRTIPGPLPHMKTVFCCTSCIIEALHHG